MKGFVEDIENLAIRNQSFRKVLFTANDTQLVLMTLKAGEEIGEEVHNLDQFIRVEEATGTAWCTTPGSRPTPTPSASTAKQPRH